MWPFVLYSFLVLLVVTGMLLLSSVLGQRHEDAGTGAPYEGGIVSEGSARVRLSAKFYLFAMLFVAFDLETAFLTVWAVAARRLGWAGLGEALVFMGILAALLRYLARVGALDVSSATPAGQGRWGG